jgi:pimeloyl-[acyl-carrier protein] methyl ester esterase
MEGSLSDTRLHVSVTGEGPDLVLLHGWGLHGGVWSMLLPRLAAHYRVSVIDLPGHGRSPGRLGDLEQAASAVLAAAPPAAAWVGWSLGGMIATTAAAQAPERVTRLLLVASNPRFTQQPDWPCAMAPATLAAFADGLATDFEATLGRFLTLQFRGVKGAGDTLRGLRAELAARPPAPESLRDGLAILAGADLRPALAGYPGPVAAVLGALDTLVPSGVAGSLAALRPDMTITALAGAGHAPFLTHPGHFLGAVEAWLA